MPDFAARASRRFTSLAVRRTVTGLAVSRVGGVACEHVSPVKIRQALWGATSFRLREHCASNTTLLMSDLEAPQQAHEDVPLPGLSTDTREALFKSAHRNGRTVHEEAEHIIKSHLAASDEDGD